MKKFLPSMLALVSVASLALTQDVIAAPATSGLQNGNPAYVASDDNGATQSLTFRRKYTDASKRYYNSISYTVNGETKELYHTDNPMAESYYVAPQKNVWQTEGAYIDLTDKIIEVPADAENFIIRLWSDPDNANTRSKWSQDAVFVDWNGNGSYIDEGETNGVLNIKDKPNNAVISAAGALDTITIPAGLQPGSTYSLLILMNEPLGVNGTQDFWGKDWDWTKEMFADGVCSLINGQAYELTVRIGEPLVKPEPTVVNVQDIYGLLTVFDCTKTTETPDSKITLTEYSDGTYGILLENYGVSESEPIGLGDVDIYYITRDGNSLKCEVSDYPLLNGMVTANNVNLTGTYDDTDLVFHLDIDLGFIGVMTADFTTVEPEQPGLSFRRYSSDGSKRYYNNISYIVNGETTELYAVANPLDEPYYVAPVEKSWQNEGAYIDFTDKVIEVPADAENFTMVLKSVNGATFSSKWSQNAIFVDWNNNGDYTDEGETNGVINLGVKANASGGALVVTEAGEQDVIALPEGLNVGDTFSLLITMMEPLDPNNGFNPRWDEGNWNWTKEIFADGVCSLVNGQAYELTLSIIEGTTSAIDSINTENAEAEYFNLQGMKVSANNLTPGIYVVRKGTETFKTLVK